MFSSIKTTLIALMVSAIIIVSFSVLIFAVSEHEALYLEAVESDLDALSTNMADDIVGLMANDPDPFELSIPLLRLDQYDNVKYARILDAEGKLLQGYYGQAGAPEDQKPPLPAAKFDPGSIQPGMSETEGELVALKPIGEERLRLGYLLIVNDIRGPLDQSRRALLLNVAPLALVVVTLSIVAAFLLHHKMLSPLTRLSRFARDVERTKDYRLRIEVAGRNEVAALGHNINRMMSTINSETDKNLKQTRKLIEQRKAMERLANFDSLTGLPNRQFFMESLSIELTRARRASQDVALMFFDLDGFKGVNDSFGHETGDLLLIEVSKRIKDHMRGGDLMARLGGDEFLILLHNNPDEFTLVNIANRIIEGLQRPFTINNWEINTGVSIGIARASDAGYDLSKFVSNADVAMYRSKMTGRGVYTLFAQEMMEDARRKLQIANSIGAAIEGDEFALVYQGKVSPEADLVGFEANLRWFSPKLGAVFPNEFIPIAEQSGKMVSLTRWVLERLCRDMPRIHEITGKKLTVSVNLSALDLKKPGLFEFIAGLLATYQIDPAWLEFEVTESAYLENFDMANRFFQATSQAGCSLALDDFGTGYSSLSYLTKIPINTLKIDRQFVNNLGSSEKDCLVTEAIIGMARRLHLKICAEGVETREQFDFLVENGCDQLQGYLFFKPVRLQELTARPGMKLAG